MTSMIENSGAQRGYLLLPEGGQWWLASGADSETTESYVQKPVPIAESDRLSQAILHYVARTQQTILLDDASQSGEFVNDPHVQRHEVKSLLCTPLVNQGKISAILYLENNLSPGIFTPERVEILTLLSSQIAISIDNARTHDRLEQLLEERSKALTSAEAQIRSLFNNSPLGTALTSLEGQILTVNKAMLDLLRTSEDELMQLSATNIYADMGDRKEILAEVQESGFVQGFGVQLLRPDGSNLYANLNMSKLVLQGNEVLLTMVEDVTDKIVAETTLRESEQRFKALFGSMPLPIYYWQRRGEDFVLVDCNDAADEFTGGGARKVIGWTATKMYPDRPDIREDFYRCFIEKVTAS